MIHFWEECRTEGQPDRQRDRRKDKSDFIGFSEGRGSNRVKLRLVSTLAWEKGIIPGMIKRIFMVIKMTLLEFFLNFRQRFDQK